MSQFRQDFNKAVEASIPVFKEVAKGAAYVASFVIFILLNLALCDSGLALIALWVFATAGIIVAIQYHRVVYQREQDEIKEAYYAKLDQQWQIQYGKPYPR
jgi:hypothetical protein